MKFPAFVVTSHGQILPGGDMEREGRKWVIALVFTRREFAQQQLAELSATRAKAGEDVAGLDLKIEELGAAALRQKLMAGNVPYAGVFIDPHTGQTAMELEAFLAACQHAIR